MDLPIPCDRLLFSAHTLKGSGSIIGLRGIASLAHHLEDILDHFEREGSQVARSVAEKGVI